MSQFEEVIIDADSLVYRVGFANDDSPLSYAIHSLNSMINKIKAELEVEEYFLVIGGGDNFRDDIAVSTVYKGNRPIEKPVHYGDIRRYIADNHPRIVAEGCEADDVCSSLLYEKRQRSSARVLAAIDKDLWNTPGWHFNYHPKKWTTTYVTMREANRNFLRQLITGDASDNVPGLPFMTYDMINRYSLPNASLKGCGPKTAEALERACLDNEDFGQAIYDCYSSWAYEAGEQCDEYLLEQGRLLWMTRKFTNISNTPVLWEIPNWMRT